MIYGPFKAEFHCTFCDSSTPTCSIDASIPNVCEECCEDNMEGHDYEYCRDERDWKCKHCFMSAPYDAWMYADDYD